MALTAIEISPNRWLVSGDYNGTTVKGRKVQVAPGQSSTRAIAIVEEIIDGPSAAHQTAEGSQSHAEAVVKECQRRVDAVADRLARETLVNKAAAGVLSTFDLDTWRNGLAWSDSMRAACLPLIADPQLDFTDDTHWPEVPNGVAALAAPYRSLFN